MRKLVWKERLHNLKGFSIPVIVIAILVSAIYYFNRGEWVSSEIEVTMRNIAAQEDDTRIIYRALVEKIDGTVVHVMMTQSSHFREGGKAIVMESVNSDSGNKKYRFLRPVPGS
ncbi:Uncharacterised protein [Halioglobus japonicus]|nr:Uncharacterised protein [Halioglobus japonicus]CAA0117904.1 Uncharacterised protein [Halioglobus japonicus]